MDRRFAAPGAEVRRLTEQAPVSLLDIPESQLDGTSAWDQYIRRPDKGRIGIACSGGGIRSASYCLGALQVLRRKGVLDEADYLACVSGGGYISIAHTILVSESLKRHPRATQPDVEEDLFGALPPWAPLSPEERHLRDHSTYLAPGSRGKAWFFLNVLYGMIRHLVPFAAALYVFGAIWGLALGRWIGPTLRDTPGRAPVSFSLIGWIILGLAGVAGIFLLIRQFVQASSAPSGATLASLQSMIMFILTVQVVIAVMLIGLPALLVYLSNHPIEWISRSPSITVGTASGGGLFVSALAAALSRKELSGIKQKLAKLLMPLLTALIGPLTIIVPFIGVTYWNAMRANDFMGRPLVFALIAGGMLAFSWFFNEATPNMHLVYRERLATAFVGYRKPDASGRALGYSQSPWNEAVNFSEIFEGAAAAKLPKLVVCAAINVSGDEVPPGRLAGSFTFEHDFSGSPITGYIPTVEMERRAGTGVLTLPALIAISGAAVSPSMGKMTRPGLRMLMALFNVRLGVWLPNPLRPEKGGPPPLRPYELENARPQSRVAVEQEAPKSLVTRLSDRVRKPGTAYTFRELIGRNDSKAPFVYVTDGGHWDNLGLVELLRRGCTQILCFDAAGDALGRFWTISEAIGLARTELGVHIEIDLSPLEAGDDGVSERDYAEGKIVYPDGTRGVLIFAKIAMPKDAPQDAKAYRQRRPKFPTDPTSDQLFNDLKFESYRSLGVHAAEGAVGALRAWREANGFSRITV